MNIGAVFVARRDGRPVTDGGQRGLARGVMKEMPRAFAELRTEFSGDFEMTFQLKRDTRRDATFRLVGGEVRREEIIPAKFLQSHVGQTMIEMGVSAQTWTCWNFALSKLDATAGAH